MHAAYGTSTPVVNPSFFEVLLLIFEILNFGFFLPMRVESLCLFIYECFVILFILRNIQL